jgi:hypothetical protein
VTTVSLTLSRHGDREYQVTFWTDGVARWDGTLAARLGAWQSHVDTRWLHGVEPLVRKLPAPTTRLDGATAVVVVQSEAHSQSFSISELPDEQPDLWRLGMILDGMALQARWVPLDSQEESDLAPWADSVVLTFTPGAAVGQGLARPEGLVVLAGSTASTSTAATLETTYREQREQLIADGGFDLNGECFVVTRHLLFASPSAAASVLAGSNTNGRRAWRDNAGQSWARLDLDRK